MSKFQVIYHSMFGHQDEVIAEFDTQAEASMEIAARRRRMPSVHLANYSIRAAPEKSTTKQNITRFKAGDRVKNAENIGRVPALGAMGTVTTWEKHSKLLSSGELDEREWPADLLVVEWDTKGCIGPFGCDGMLTAAEEKCPVKDCTGHPVAVQMGGAEPPKQEFVKYDGGKPALSGIPLEATQGVARVISYGRKKYSPGGFRKAAQTDGAQERYVAGALRHLMQMQNPDGTFTDESLAALDGESGLPHIDHAICGLLMLRSLLTKFETLPADPGVGKEPPK